MRTRIVGKKSPGKQRPNADVTDGNSKARLKLSAGAVQDADGVSLASTAAGPLGTGAAADGEGTTSPSSPSPAPRLKRRRTSDAGAALAGDAAILEEEDQDVEEVGMQAAVSAVEDAGDDPEAGFWGEGALVAAATAAAVLDDVEDPGDDLGDGAWRSGLEELRRQNPLRRRQSGQGRPQAVEQPGADDLLRLLRRTIRLRGDWAAITAPALPHKWSDMAAAVRQLEADELAAVLGACVQRYEPNPRERASCVAWVQQVLENGAAAVVGRPDVREAVRPLVRTLARRLGSHRHSGEALAALGRWKLAHQLAKARKEQRGAATASAPGGTAAAPAAVAAGGKEQKRPRSQEGETTTVTAAPRVPAAAEDEEEDAAEEDDEDDADEGGEDADDDSDSEG